MATPASQPSLLYVDLQVSQSLIGAKSTAQVNLSEMQAGAITTIDVFELIDALNASSSNINAVAAALGSANYPALNDFVTAQTPGYNRSSVAITAGTYTTGSGAVSLTTAAAHGRSPGDLIVVSGATGTGSFASINGTFTLGAGTTGSTLVFTIATGLTMTITGGSVVVGGLYTNDVIANLNAIAAVIAWIFNNTSGVVWYTLTSSGARTPASFTSAQTAGLQTTLSTLIASIN